MNCPGCGAALKAANDSNSFLCAHCGYHPPQDSLDGVAVIGEAVGAICPLCRAALLSARIEGETVCYCGQCHGFLAEIDTFGVIVSKRRAHHRPHERRTEPFNPAELKRVLTCPNCRQRMDTHPYFGGGNAVVDTCEDCGLIWLDEGDLAVIERYVRHVHQIERTHTLFGGRYQGEG
jgi:Zn-finger nucleic acid-binding protein